jgi:hypothetical protein
LITKTRLTINKTTLIIEPEKKRSRKKAETEQPKPTKNPNPTYINLIY